MLKGDVSMLKLDELKLLKMIEDNDIEAIKSYVEGEIVLQLNLSKSDNAKMKAIALYSKKTKKKADKMGKEILAGAFMQGEYTAIIDGHMGIRLKMDINRIPNIINNESFFEDGAEKFDVRGLFENKRYYKEIKIDVEEMLIQYKKWKTTKNDAYKFFQVELANGEQSFFNIEYMIEAHNMIDINESVVVAGDNRLNPIFIINEEFYNAECIVLPVRLPV